MRFNLLALERTCLCLFCLLLNSLRASAQRHPRCMQAKARALRSAFTRVRPHPPGH